MLRIGQAVALRLRVLRLLLQVQARLLRLQARLQAHPMLKIGQAVVRA